MGRFVTLRISASKSRAALGSVNVSTTSTPFVPTTKPALLPAFPPSTPRAAYTPSPIFLMVKSGASAARANEQKNRRDNTSAVVRIRMAEDGNTKACATDADRFVSAGCCWYLLGLRRGQRW